MSIVIKAEGEAQSAKLVGEAIKDNPGFIQLRRIDAARDIASTVSRYENKQRRHPKIDIFFVWLR